eukprot:GHVR01008166.1.p1 GENE.GHVR01008166.1~~GHVR01008166.1.p1  ORF type:complete len:113 (-),score=39.63 GHVR01008166.1:515-853(-)
MQRKISFVYTHTHTYTQFVFSTKNIHTYEYIRCTHIYTNIRNTIHTHTHTHTHKHISTHLHPHIPKRTHEYLKKNFFYTHTYTNHSIDFGISLRALRAHNEKEFTSSVQSTV